MKLYSVISYDNCKKLKILGLTIYKKTDLIDRTKRKFLCGLLKVVSVEHKNIYYVLGVKLFSRKKHLSSEEIMKGLFCSFQKEMRAMLSVYNLHSRVFPQFKNCNYGKNLAIVGCGPTSNYYKTNNRLIHIALNKAFKMKNIVFKYLFFVDMAHKGTAFEEIEKLDCIKFLGYHCNPEFSYCNENVLYDENNLSFCLIPEAKVIKNNAYRFYSNAHRNEIFYDIETSPLMDFGSVSFPAIHFALYTHPKKIYLIGCDCSNNGYFNNEKQPVWQDHMLTRTFYGYNKLKKFVSVYYPETEIVSVNPVGLKGLFRDVYTRDYIEAHPEVLEEDRDIQYFEDECVEENICV